MKIIYFLKWKINKINYKKKLNKTNHNGKTNKQYRKLNRDPNQINVCNVELVSY